MRLRQSWVAPKPADDMQEFFDDMAKNGMAAMMKYYNDPNFLRLLGEKLGDVAGEQGAFRGIRWRCDAVARRTDLWYRPAVFRRWSARGAVG